MKSKINVTVLVKLILVIYILFLKRVWYISEIMLYEIYSLKN